MAAQSQSTCKCGEAPTVFSKLRRANCQNTGRGDAATSHKYPCARNNFYLRIIHIASSQLFYLPVTNNEFFHLLEDISLIYHADIYRYHRIFFLKYTILRVFSPLLHLDHLRGSTSNVKHPAKETGFVLN